MTKLSEKLLAFSFDGLMARLTEELSAFLSDGC